MCDRGSGSGCFFTSRSKEGRDTAPDIATSPRRQPHTGVQPAGLQGLQGLQGQQGLQGLRPKDPPPMVIQGDFRKVSGISNEIFRQIETVENDHDATTAAALEAVERRGEMVVRLLEPRAMGRQAADHIKRFFAMQDAKHSVQLVEIVKRPGQTLGLYIREGNGMERSDGVFISRIALESAVYNSGCLKVGDEILAVNLVDVTRMSLDDVVIIMSIPRRLVLVTRQGGAGPPLQQAPHKPPPVVVIKKELRDDEEHQLHPDDLHEDRRYEDSLSRRRGPGSRELSGSRSRLGLSSRMGSHQDIQDGLHGMDPSTHNGLSGHGSHQGLGLSDLYYNSRPERSMSTWSYQPPPPVVTDQSSGKGGGPQHFQPYERGYPKTLESLAEKVHAFYPGQPMPSRMQQSGRQTPQYYSRGKHMPRSGSDQHLPRVEYQHAPQRTAHTMLRSGMKQSGSVLSHYTSGRYSQAGGGPLAGTLSATLDRTLASTLSGAAGSVAGLQHHAQQGYRRHRPGPGPALDYASDTEATCSSSPRSSYYYYRGRASAQGSAAASAALPRLGSATLSRGGSLRSNSLPRDHRGPLPLGRSMVPSSPASTRHQLSLARPQLLDHHYDSDSALSAPDLPLSRRDRVRAPAFTADEYRAWLQRTPSTSAIYERIRANRDAALAHQRASRLTFSAENLNLLDRAREEGSSYYGYRAPLTSTLDRHTFGAGRSPSASALSSVGSVGRSQSMRRMRQHLLELEASARHHTTLRSSSSVVPESTRSRIMEINPSEFLKYKMEKPLTAPADPLGDAGTPGVSGLLWVHLLAGRGLRASGTGSAATTPSTPSAPSPLGAGGSTAMRDLYCVLECDRVHKARTVVRTGDLVFDWDETFELDLVSNRELDFLIYSWDPQYRHKLCYKGSVHLSSLLRQSPIHQLALKIEPRGTLYLRLRHTDPHQTFSRKHATGSHPLLTRPGGKAFAATAGLLFGVEMETVVTRENMSGGVPGGVATSVTLATQGAAQVPLIIRRCVEEIERRGLDIIGLYRLCGSATKKRILREAFERNARTVDLSPDNVPDINVITGVLKDYLRELPEPLFTKCLYQMMLDALTVCLPDDPEGNAKLMFSILDCLPKVNRVTLIYLMDHLALVVSQSERNKMTPQNLAVCFGPVMMLQTEEGRDLDFIQTINVLRYLLEIWPCKSVREILDASTVSHPSSALTPKAPPLPAKPAPSALLTSLSRVQNSSPVVVSSPISDSSPSPSPPEEAEILRSIPKAAAGAAMKRGPPPRVEPRRSLPKQTLPGQAMSMPPALHAGLHGMQDAMGNGMSGTLPRQPPRPDQPPGLPPRNSSTLQRNWSANGNGASALSRTGLTSRPLPSPPVASRVMPAPPPTSAASSAPYGGSFVSSLGEPSTVQFSQVGGGSVGVSMGGGSVMEAIKNIESYQHQHEAGNASPRSVRNGMNGQRNGTGLVMNLVVPDASGDRDTSPATSDQGDQLETPTSSTGTEDSRREGEAGERGTEGDEEASEDDDDDRFRSGRGSSTSVVMRDVRPDLK